MSASPEDRKGVDISLAIAWSYFIVYSIVFFIVSIVCAERVRKLYNESREKTTDLEDLDPDNEPMTKSSAFVHWAKLLWEKKKIYIQLVPHFFDQASDFGVIYAYYKIHEDGDRIGINTLYLFGVSIGVIIFHRIVSSIAVYRLTNNYKYAILQIFDALMIKCIWTNYLLETNEPSNAQRYLQVLEATFEVK